MKNWGKWELDILLRKLLETSKRMALQATYSSSEWPELIPAAQGPRRSPLNRRPFITGAWSTPIPHTHTHSDRDHSDPPAHLNAHLSGVGETRVPGENPWRMYKLYRQWPRLGIILFFFLLTNIIMKLRGQGRARLIIKRHWIKQHYSKTCYIDN